MIFICQSDTNSHPKSVGSSERNDLSSLVYTNKTSVNKFWGWHLLHLISTNIETQRLLKSQGWTKMETNSRMFFCVSASTEQWHKWILMAYFHVNFNSHFLAAFCQHINTFFHTSDISSGNYPHLPVSNGIKLVYHDLGLVSPHEVI